MSKRLIKKKTISFVIPTYNEEANILNLYSLIQIRTDNSKYHYKYYFIDDGSTDNSWSEILKLKKENKNVFGYSFSRNFGHQAALQAGYEMASGDAIISIDCDLQQPPELIPKLIKAWEKGYLIVTTIRTNTEGVGLFKKFTSYVFYTLLNSMSNLSIQSGEADFRLLDKRVLKIINNFQEDPKFYRGLVNWVGFKKTSIKYVARRREHGISSYTFRKMIELARVGLTSFSMRPLKIIIAFGALLTSVSSLTLLIMLYIKFFVSYEYFSNTIVIAMVILFTTGILILFQGVMAIYLVDIYNSAKARPSYIISKKI